MNDAQTLVLQTYDGGDYAWLTDDSGETERTLARYQGEPDPIEEYIAAEGGDTLLTFLYRELADDGEPISKTEAIRRIDKAIEDLTAIRHEIEGGLE
ncbi:hypothetical protein [Brucella intermedia]|uniref:hypothetical protein n=1 Tax=Brucella intermedia TaxID=94625 RepID=UPI00224A85AB|nr:hypothetical protein [Brucella intermedia]